MINKEVKVVFENEKLPKSDPLRKRLIPRLKESKKRAGG